MVSLPDCSICLDSIDINLDDTSPNRLYTTLCGHKFHFVCLFRWCTNNNSCPDCRSRNVMSFGGDNVATAVPRQPSEPVNINRYIRTTRNIDDFIINRNIRIGANADRNNQNDRNNRNGRNNRNINEDYNNNNIIYNNNINNNNNLYNSILSYIRNNSNTIEDNITINQTEEYVHNIINNINLYTETL